MNAIENAITKFANSYDLPAWITECMAEDMIHRAADLPAEEITEDWMAGIADEHSDGWIDSVNW